LEALLNDTDDEVASGALAVLAKRDQGIQVIGRYLLNSIAPLGTEAVKALSESGHADALTVMIEALRRGESRFRTDLRNGIANFGPTGVRALLSAAMSDEWLQSDCEVVLASHPSVATPLITELIDRDPSATPSFLIRALGAGNGTQAITTLDKAFDSGSLKVQFEVIRAWGRFPAGIVRDRLTKVMLGNDHVLRTQAVVAIGKARVKQAAPLLMALLKDDSFPAELTIDALGALEASEAGDLLVERFLLAPLGIRFAILRACKRIQTPKCMKLLYDAAGDLNVNIRNEALKLLALR
jgi:HEAT repeat protein